MKLLFKFLIVLMFFGVISCDKRKLPSTAMSEFAGMRKNATPEFRQGWEDGCETGSASIANYFHKMMVYDSVKVDGYKITQSTDYKTAWNFAWWYCYRHMHVKHKASIWEMFFGGYK